MSERAGKFVGLRGSISVSAKNTRNNTAAKTTTEKPTTLTLPEIGKTPNAKGMKDPIDDYGNFMGPEGESP